MDIYNRSPHKSKVLNYSEIHLFGIEMAFVELQDYYRIIEDGLAMESGKRITAYNLRFEEMLAGKQEEGWAAHLDDQYTGEIVKLDYYFPHAFRSSFLIQIFSFIEFELKEICNHHHRVMKTDISITDLKGGSDLDKAKIYLAKVCKVAFNDLQPEWNYLVGIRRVRNLLVHHAGILVPDHNDRKSIVEFIESQDGIAIKEEPTDRRPDLAKEDLTVMLTGKVFNETFLTQAEGFFKKLLDTGVVKLRP